MSSTLGKPGSFTNLLLRSCYDFEQYENPKTYKSLKSIKVKFRTWLPYQVSRCREHMSQLARLAGPCLCICQVSSCHMKPSHSTEVQGSKVAKMQTTHDSLSQHRYVKLIIWSVARSATCVPGKHCTATTYSGRQRSSNTSAQCAPQKPT